MNEEQCPFRVAHGDAIERNQKDIQKLFQLDGQTTKKIEVVDNKIDAKHDAIKNMIIAGLGVSIIQLVLFITSIIIVYLRIKSG